MNLNESSISKFIPRLNHKDLIIFLIPIAIFSYYLKVFDPGILRYDSFNQLHQIATHSFTNWHPFFHTFIEMICLKIYSSPVSICILQILTFSVIWMVICKYNRQDDEKRFEKTFILQLLVTLAICLIPINAIYSISLVKDILFSYFLLLMCFMIKVLLDKKGNVGYGFIIIMSLTMAFVAQLRPNGLYIVIPTLIILGIYLFKKNYNKTLLAIPVLAIIFILLIASLNVAFDVEDNEKSAVLAKVSHMLADYDLNLDLAESDKDKIHALIDEKSIKDKYEITYSDPIYAASDKQVFHKNPWDYCLLAIKHSLYHPSHFIEYMSGSSPIVWDITRDDSWVGFQYKITLEEDKNDYYGVHKSKPAADYDNASSKNIGTDEYNALHSISETFKNNIILDTLFNSPALYMYLALIIMVLIHLITKSKEIYLLYLPNLFNIFAIFVSTPIQDNRYLYPNLLVCYLLIIILISVIAQKGLKNRL